MLGAQTIILPKNIHKVTKTDYGRIFKDQTLLADNWLKWDPLKWSKLDWLEKLGFSLVNLLCMGERRTHMKL